MLGGTLAHQGGVVDQTIFGRIMLRLESSVDGDLKEQYNTINSGAVVKFLANDIVQSVPLVTQQRLSTCTHLKSAFSAPRI